MVKAGRIVARVAIGFGIFLALFFAVGMMLTKEYQVERSLLMRSSPENIFEHVHSFKKWEKWSPWIAKDPTIINSYSGPAEGVGSQVSWKSEKSGSGSQEIILSEPPHQIRTRLNFGEMGQAEAYWKFENKEGGTLVRWGLVGKNEGAIGGYFSLMMDGFVGEDYEEGLVRLKTLVE